MIDPASVIGLGFPVEAVVDLVPREAAAGVPTHLLSLAAKQFVRPGVGEDEFYRFGHSVIKDATYRSLLKRTRADLHERFVGWAEPVNKERGRELEFEEILGYHLEQAYRYRGQLGPIDERTIELGRRASEKLTSAGRRAFGRGDAPAAADLFRRAAEVLPELAPMRLELLTERAEAEIEQGSFEVAGDVLAAAQSGAEQIDDPRLVDRATVVGFQLALGVSGSIGDSADAVTRIRSAIEHFERTGDRSGLARAWRLLAVIFGTIGQFDRAAEAAANVADIAMRSGDARMAARSAVTYALAALYSSMPVPEVLQRGEELRPAVGTDRIAEARYLGILAVLYAMQGQFQPARELIEQSRAIAVELGPSLPVAAGSLESSRVEMLAGDAAAAERELRRDYATLAAVDEIYYRSSIACMLGHALWALDRYDEAGQFFEVAQRLADPDDLFTQVFWRTGRSKLLAQAGLRDQAVDLCREATRLASSSDDIEQLADSLSDLADVLRLSDRVLEAESVLTDALDLYERKGDVISAARVRLQVAIDRQAAQAAQ